MKPELRMQAKGGEMFKSGISAFFKLTSLFTILEFQKSSHDAPELVVIRISRPYNCERVGRVSLYIWFSV